MAIAPINRDYQHLDYIKLNMNLTRDAYNAAVAKKVLFCAMPIILVLGLAELLVKNGIFILANCFIAYINGACSLIDKIADLFLEPPPPPRWRVRSSVFSSVNAAPPLPNQQLPADDLAVFGAALKKYTSSRNPASIQVENIEYSMWWDGEIIHIRDKANQNNKIIVQIDEPGRFTSIKVNGVDQRQIPDAFLPVFQVGFIKALDLSSKYDYSIQIIRRGLKEIPGYHLNRFVQLVQVSPGSQIVVGFLKNNLDNDDGVDAGGVSRDYMDDLFLNITKMGTLRFHKNPNTELLMPVAKNDNGDVPTLSPEESGVYRQIGQVMMYCYKNLYKTLMIGKHFDNGLFSAAFSLLPAEIDTPFAQLPLSTKLKMCEAIAQANDESPYIIQLARAEGRITRSELREVEQFLYLNGQLPESIDHNAFDPKNPVQKAALLQALIQSLFKRPGFGDALAACHAVAGGMQQMLRAIGPLARYNEISPQEFSAKIQGSIDRAFVAGQIQVEHGIGEREAILKKVDWLKEWILNEATQEEILKFIKFVSGASTLPSDRKIIVEAQSHFECLPAPRAHSCTFRLEISPMDASYGEYNDRNKENFIKALKDLALTDPSAYSYG